jgi:hypothetical protein
LPICKHQSATAISAPGRISGQNSDNMISSLFMNRTTRVDIGQGMITVLIWKKAQFWYGKRHALIYLSHTNVFQHWIKKNKINFTHTHQTMSDWYRFRDDNSPDMEKGMHCSIYKGAWYHVVLFIKKFVFTKR